MLSIYEIGPRNHGKVTEMTTPSFLDKIDCHTLAYNPLRLIPIALIPREIVAKADRYKRESRKFRTKFVVSFNVD
jgi:hypothetical protein